ncbi:HEL283Cp [Eremothecium sinecaudum]|uniref:HEL283Cp n=1 Tax=Eremothecium sinecaudum TaxID=45286 RepID=A0A109UZ87_9SACH|nr:HEL283Cp [Eremothecium sinecaudum]AMD20998.1 HEL283Cp [Eremothecium sinecaudum]
MSDENRKRFLAFDFNENNNVGGSAFVGLSTEQVRKCDERSPSRNSESIIDADSLFLADAIDTINNPSIYSNAGETDVTNGSIRDATGLSDSRSFSSLERSFRSLLKPASVAPPEIYRSNQNGKSDILSQDRSNTISDSSTRRSNTNDGSLLGHSRQRSEVDELVEHLDQYISATGDDSKLEDISATQPENDPVPVDDDDDFFYEKNEHGEFISPISVIAPLIVTGGDDDYDFPIDFSESSQSRERSLTADKLNEQTGNGELSSRCRSKNNSLVDLSVDTSKFHSESMPALLNTRVSPYPIYDGSFDDTSSAPKNFRVVNDNRGRFYLNDTATEDEESIGQTKESILYEFATSDGNASKASSFQERNFLGNLPNPNLQLQESSKTGDILRTASDTVDRMSGKSSTEKAQLDKNVRLVSSYVEELKLKYFPTSNSLQPPPNLPLSLKTKNTADQQQSIKVRIRTSSKQIGIKHGRAKQKLLSLETANEAELPTNLERADHTKEFQEMLHRERGVGDSQPMFYETSGFEGYDSDDLLAPLRESKQGGGSRASMLLKRTDTITSYFTKTQERLANNDCYPDRFQNALQHTESRLTLHSTGVPSGRPTDIDSESEDAVQRDSVDYTSYRNQYGTGLKVANPDSNSG